jgi:DeoR family deoxyribose operon repressor
MEARRRAGVSAILAGGALRKESLIFESPEGIELVRRYRAVKAFLCAAGASAQLGVTCPTQGEAELKRTAIASSRVRILLADSGIFGRVSPAWFADLKDFDAVVTDSGISLEYVDSIQELGIAIHVV